jgi:dephospho-CoA kinase
VIVIGLTGSIGMGKSTAAKILRRLGLPIHDADRCVHRLMGKGGAAVAAVEAAFPGVVRDGAVDRTELGRRVFGDDAKLKRLEAILHPLVRREEQRFLHYCRAQGRRIVVLDIPLLFETGGDRRCDTVIVVSAPHFLQDQRVLRRRGTSRQRLEEIRAKQMSDAEKRRRADYVVQTGGSKRATWVALVRILRHLQKQ